jgi:uncharacterized membrane protein required for colicin V production
VDIVLGVVIVGCGLAGLWWGALRMVAVLAATAAAVAAGRWVAPAAAALVSSTLPPEPAVRAGAIVVCAVVAAILVLVAARGLRRALEALRLGWLDRLAGLLVSAGLAGIVLGLLLALAALNGQSFTSPLAAFLTRTGQTLLAVQSLSANRINPSSTPATPTSNGQQPN